MVTKEITKPYIVSGNVPVGACGFCDFSAQDGVLVRHIDHFTLYSCSNCDGLVCKEHLLSCGLCYGCCAEEHGLGEGH